MSARSAGSRPPVGQVVVGSLLVVGLLPYLWALRGMAPEAVWIPLGVVGVTLVLALVNVGFELRRRSRVARAAAAAEAGETPAAADEAEEPIETWDAQSTRQLAWVVGMAVVALLVGLLPATVAYITAYLLVETQLRTWVSLVIVAVYTLAIYLFFINFLGISPLAPSLIL